MGGTIKLVGAHALVAQKMLHDVTVILEQNKIPYTLEGGTLLGIVREGRLLPWDTDMDLTITSKVATKLLSLRWKFWVKGYRTRIRYYKNDTPPFLKGEPRILKIQSRQFLFFKGPEQMDIFIKKKVDKEYYWTVGVKQPVMKSVSSHFYEELDKFQFNGKSYSIPKSYDAYLSARYGDWKTPKKEWDFRKDDLSIKH